MLEYDRLFKAVIYGLIDCLRSKLSDLTCSITNICKKKKKDTKALFPFYRGKFNDPNQLV